MRRLLFGTIILALAIISGCGGIDAVAAKAETTCRLVQTTPEAATLFVEGLGPLNPHQGYRVYLFAPSGVQLFVRAYNPPGGSEPFLDPEHGIYEGQVWLVKGEGAEHNSFTKVKELATCTLTR